MGHDLETRPAGSPTTATWSRWRCRSTSSASRGPKAPRPGASTLCRSYPRNVRHRISSRYTDRNGAASCARRTRSRASRGCSPGPQPRARPDPHRQPHRRRDGSPTDARHRRTSGRSRRHRALGHHAEPDPQRHAQPRLLAGRGRRGPARRSTSASRCSTRRSARSSWRGSTSSPPRSQAVFTRTVARPGLGLKLTGKEGAQRHRGVRGPRRGQQPAAAREPGVRLRVARPAG